MIISRTLAACAVAISFTHCGSTPQGSQPAAEKEIWLGPERVQQVTAAAAQRGLVDTRYYLPDVPYELLYRTKKNVCWQPLYPQDMPCLLHVTTVRKLQVAQQILRSQGYGLKIWDAWRPPEVQEALFDHGGYTGMFTPPSLMWSRHCSGTAVDVTLVDASGRELEMPTGFDEASPRAAHTSLLPPEDVRQRRLTLQLAMTAAGFSMLSTEWWHFDDAQYDQGGVPPVVFASEVGLTLPAVRKARQP